MFKPLKAENKEIDIDQLKFPLLVSTKLDGYRCIINNGQILTCSLKQVQNKQLREKLEGIRKWTEDNNCILDGEIYSDKLTFQELNKFFMAHDLESPRSIKRYGCVLAIPDHVKFYCFDCITNDNFNEPFIDRIKGVEKVTNLFKESVALSHVIVTNKDELENEFEKSVDNGEEGLMLRNLNGIYKKGRASFKQNIIFKYKPFVTVDAKILKVIQSTIVDPNVEKTINELGRSQTSRKKNDRILIEKAAAFLVDYEGKETKVNIAMTDSEKEDIWKHRKSYIGKWVEYKFLKVGMKDDGKPRHANTIRMRPDKDD